MCVCDGVLTGCGLFCAEYDTSQGSEVKEKEKARHLKDEKHATA